MSFRDSLFVAAQTIVSNGFGASVGLEAAYAQMGGAIASITGRFLNLRRSDLRTCVGAGAGAAIGAAFGAPLTGAFYAFEIVIGSYTVANVAAVIAAAIAALADDAAGALRADGDPDHHAGRLQARRTTWRTRASAWSAPSSACGHADGGLDRRADRPPVAVAAPVPPDHGRRLLIGVALIRAADALGRARRDAPRPYRQARHRRADLPDRRPRRLASVISLGFGFRGGLFFASLYLGSLLGRLFAVLLDTYAGANLDPTAASLVGMGALAVASSAGR